MKRTVVDAMAADRQVIARSTKFRNTFFLWLLLPAISLNIAGAVFAWGQDATDRSKAVRQPEDYRSRNFLIHTDLAKDDAEVLLKKLETMLKIISRYWGAPSRKVVECYVVDDLDCWPPASLTPEIRNTVRHGGITIARGTRRGSQFNMNAIVYASNRFGTPQHEAVHAYCYQTFGVTGPTWYAEGMAEMGNYWVEGDSTVTAPDYVIQFLRRSPRKTSLDITDNQQQTGDGWQNYAWRWALCHFLVNNDNYNDRFRPLGVGFLTGKRVSFARTYESKMEELEFEFQFFIDHLQRGFDVNRCAWDWNAKYRQQNGTRPVVSKIQADKGWQPSGLKVVKEQQYRLAVEGTWKLSGDATEVSADGDASSAGSLVGVLFHDHQLSAEFELGGNGTFTAEEDGQLLLRCRDDWSQLNDNKGTVSVELMSADDE